MNNLLIDFDSPKLRKDDAFLIPQYLIGSPLNSTSTPSYSGGEESNPFDMVVCQAAAQCAAENDPFEMVLNVAMNSQKEIIDVETSPHESSDPFKKSARRSMSLPDLRQLDEIDNQKCNDKKNSIIPLANIEHNFSNIGSHPRNNFFHGSEPVLDNPEWSCLDDILPPDSFLNSTMDMSCFLDDKLPISSSGWDNSKPNIVHDATMQRLHSTSAGIENLNINEDHRGSHKSEDELRLLTQKKIENIITRAELEVKSEIQTSLIQKRLSLSKPNQEVLALCTPRKTRNSFSEPFKESHSSFQRWSENELMKLNLILPDPTPKSSEFFSISSAHLSEFEKDLNLFKDEANISSEKMPVGDMSTLSPLPDVTPQGSGGSLPDGSEEVNQSMTFLPSPSSPVLLPLPLCEDAVRNLNLCLKYSPGSSSNMISNFGDAQANSETSCHEKNSKQAKLMLRKPTMPFKPPVKMAPMKATAPIQNMTRTRSSLSTVSKFPPKPHLVSALRKSVSKDTTSKPAFSENKRSSLKMPQSPIRPMGGSLPNLPTQGTKQPARLSSPGKPGGVLRDPVNVKKKLDSTGERNVPQISGLYFYSSPRPFRRSSVCKPGSQPRVLAEINSTSSMRKSPKRRVHALEAPRREGSILHEKENLV